MPSARQRVVLVTGASSGIGQACARLLAAQGWRVYGTSRREHLAAETTENIRWLQMDVTHDASVSHAIDTLLQQEQRLDAVVNNAGYGLAGPVECTRLEDAAAQFEVNFFGVVRVCRSVLPRMRQDGGGHIVNIGSIGGLLAIPFQSMYSASKFALDGFTESLRYEVAPFAIRVVLVEPGDHRTAFTGNRVQAHDTHSAPAYEPACTCAIEKMRSDEQRGKDPKQVARVVAKVLGAEQPRLRYTVGPLMQRSAVWMKRLLPFAATEWSMRGYYGTKNR